ncbi:hypothetical protein [Methanococcus maripaludis]|uniref:Uncharacterized protein n=4 Tax=Methanococcus maripaludis TaxID=39152 RepID=A0A8T3VUR5_METMI|nr:hypothetical protein [Methanococcus maripaludis]MDK2928548.1 hypothetical protein [Methanococcus sp.]AEK19815.1 hypothetical protein GYY_04720 [Methanococcus maripaludis X1]MBG0768388.1 hypothetical protein [Methanococcus maripaludis]BAP61003.1 hypothetical protein MMKA1_08860 [Methanococcus maripaludis KA1]BAP62961.1 hypothetical protein MMOS7_08750 [Methanococcus maripaludis OS7]
MIKLISNIIFVIAVLILLKTWYNIYEVVMRHYKKFGVRILITVILCMITIVSLIAPIYLLCYLKILLPAVPVEYIKLQSAFFAIIAVLINRFIAIKAKNAAVDYCLKKGILTKTGI